MHFLLYIPDVQTSDPAHLERVGLGDLVQGATFLNEGEGPDGRGGMVIAWGSGGRPPQRHYFSAAEQTWVNAVAWDGLDPYRYWVGVWNDAPPTPGDLRRPYQERGVPFAMGDGNEWNLPKFRELPRDIILADDGTPRFEVQRRYHTLWHESLTWYSRFAAAGDDFTFKWSEGFAFVCRAMAINYRIVPELVSHLRLLSTDTLFLAMLAITAPEEAPGG